MIKAFGPAAWCSEMIFRWAGSNDKGLVKLKADDALNVYTKFFEQEHTLEASNKDYEAGATVDVQAQKEDQEAGRKIGVPVLLVYSGGSIGSRYDFGTVWNDWVDDGVEIKKLPLGDGIGHFGAEEAPEQIAKALVEWLKGL
jgi:pimeloyl-ACP methyl ester carboxylesterase